MLVDMVESSIDREWPRHEAMQYVVDNHSWEQRIETYDEVLRAGVTVGTR